MTASGYSATTVTTSLHVNGVRDVGGPGTKITSYTGATGSCTPTCHSTHTW